MLSSLLDLGFLLKVCTFLRPIFFLKIFCRLYLAARIMDIKMAVPSDCILLHSSGNMYCRGWLGWVLKVTHSVENLSCAVKKRQSLALIGSSNQCKLIAVQKFHSQKKPLPSMSHLIQYFSKVCFRNNI